MMHSSSHRRRSPVPSSRAEGTPAAKTPQEHAHGCGIVESRAVVPLALCLWNAGQVAGLETLAPDCYRLPTRWNGFQWVILQEKALEAAGLLNLANARQRYGMVK